MNQPKAPVRVASINDKHQKPEPICPNNRQQYVNPYLPVLSFILDTNLLLYRCHKSCVVPEISMTIRFTLSLARVHIIPSWAVFIPCILLVSSGRSCTGKCVNDCKNEQRSERLGTFNGFVMFVCYWPCVEYSGIAKPRKQLAA